jgi:hypothetical protein
MKNSGGVLCIFHREELHDSVERMFRCWFNEHYLIGFSPADCTPTDEEKRRGVVGEGEESDKEEISER